MNESQLSTLLIKRKTSPFKGQWALPGGFVKKNEALDKAALRELKEETSLSNVYLEQLYTFGDPGRDPRGRVVTVSYLGLLDNLPAVKGGTDAIDAKWFPITELPDLAFDHKKILDYSLARLRNKIEYTTIGFKLLPQKFTFSELQNVYECILGDEIDKRNFRRKMEKLNILVPLNEKRNGPQRPARLFSLTKNGNV